VEALWYEKIENQKVHCKLCPRECIIPDGKAGHCLGRVNHDGILYAETYGRPVSISVDPIEKKPLYHFFPTKNILSMGTYGCNLHCPFCQNWQLSQNKCDAEEVTVENIVEMVKARGGIGIAYTYNEPTVWYEFVYDCSVALKEAGFKNVLVTNGYINPEPMEKLLPFIDAMNVDLKAFNNDFYKDLCGGGLEEVKRTLKMAAGKTHLEVTNLLIPGYNDFADEIKNMAIWIANELGEKTPVHLSAYYPRYRLNAKPTEPEKLFSAREIMLQHLNFVYTGNIYSEEGGSTVCPECGSIAIRRRGYNVEFFNMDESGKCAKCGSELNIQT
jgi:pyruvate formate lyase activating enzyme